MPQPRVLLTLAAFASAAVLLAAQPADTSHSVLGFKDFAQQRQLDEQFMAVPSPKLAGEELKIITAVPHVAGTPEDYQTALYVAKKFREDGLETQIVPYMAWLNTPLEIKVQAYGKDGKLLMTGPTPEHVKGDPYENDPRILPAFNGSSPSGDVTADVVYANYGRLQDFNQLRDMGISVKGKIVIVRYGANFRGVKAYIAQQRGAAGVIIYSDPYDDGYFRGDPYPHGPYRPATGVQRGSIEYLFKYSGDELTPGIASKPGLPAKDRLKPADAPALPKIPTTPLSWHDAEPILKALAGPAVPHVWQGALPFAYHVGGQGRVKVHMLLKMDYKYTKLWDVIGKIPGTEYPNDWVVAGNHRDAWAFGAVDPNSGTAAMLEAAHGFGVLLQSGWKPKRTIYICSWDGEEEGLIGSTEWAEDHAAQLAHAVAYFNTDVGVSGKDFNASAVPSLKNFIRTITREVPSPKGGTVYEQWKKSQDDAEARARMTNNGFNNTTYTATNQPVRIGDLGSGSDYTPFIQHLGVPSTDISSDGPYGVYHSAFDDYAWFVMNADPTFVYEQEMARVFGLEVLHMADASVLPYDYVTYGQELQEYLTAAQAKANKNGISGLDFASAIDAAKQFTTAAQAVMQRQQSESGDLSTLNAQLRQVEEDFLNPQGLPGRPWYKHTVYAPGVYTGYAAVVIPGVNEALDAKNAAQAKAQLADLVTAIQHGTATLEAAAK